MKKENTSLKVTAVIEIGILILITSLILNMMTVFAVSADSYGMTDRETSTSFRINVVSDEEARIDLSGILYHIYESELSYSDDSGMSQFDETFAFDVYSDSNGIVEFERPSAYFSVSIELDALPDGYGVDKQTEFYYPYVESSVFSIKK